MCVLTALFLFLDAKYTRISIDMLQYICGENKVSCFLEAFMEEDKLEPAVCSCLDTWSYRTLQAVITTI